MRSRGSVEAKHVTQEFLPARWIARPLTALELAFYLWLFCSTRPLHKRSYLTRDVRFQWSTPITVPLFSGLTPILARPRRRYHILHEYVMRLMVETSIPLYNSDITTLKDYANGINRHRGKRMFSWACTGPGRFVFP